MPSFWFMIIYKQLLQTLSTIKTQKNKKDSRAESGPITNNCTVQARGKKNSSTGTRTRAAATEPKPDSEIVRVMKPEQ